MVPKIASQGGKHFLIIIRSPAAIHGMHSLSDIYMEPISQVHEANVIYDHEGYTLQLPAKVDFEFSLHQLGVSI